MGKFEQAAPQADVSQVGSSHEFSKVMENAGTTSYKFTANDTAQKTVDNKFGTPEIAGLDNTSKGTGTEPPAGGEGNGASGIAKDGSKTGDQKAANSDAAQQDMSGKSEDLEYNKKNDKHDADEKQKPLTADDLQRAAEEGRLSDALTKAGVDVKDQKAVDAYLSKAFDNQIILGLTLGGAKLPANPSDADLGKALLPIVAQSPVEPMNSQIKKLLEDDPAAGYASMRQNFLDIQKQALLLDRKAEH